MPALAMVDMRSCERGGREGSVRPPTRPPAGQQMGASSFQQAAAAGSVSSCTALHLCTYADSLGVPQAAGAALHVLKQRPVGVCRCVVDCTHTHKTQARARTHGGRQGRSEMHQP